MPPYKPIYGAIEFEARTFFLQKNISIGSNVYFYMLWGRFHQHYTRSFKSQ